VGVGELCNFAAYGFAPATLVTPLGALSVLVSAIMSSYFLNEKLNSIGKIGCFLTAVGSTVMVIHAPKEGEVNSVNELLMKLKNPEFIIFTIISIGIIMVLIIQFVPRYGNKNVLIYILICSILGSFTVMSCKGLSLGFKEMFSDSLEYKQSASFLYTYLFAFIVIACIVMQMNYLNKALDIFNTAIVTTIYYVLFTLCVMIASSILFKELTNLKFIDFVGCIAGFATIICALCLIHFFKNDNQIFIDDSKITTNNDNLRNLNNNDDDYDDDEDYGDQKTKPSTAYFDNNKIIKRFLNTFNPNNVLNSVSFSNNKSNIEVSLGGSNNNTNNNYILLTTEQDDGDDGVTGATNNNNNKFSQKNFHETV
jgi:magnesium transporter